MLNEFLYGYPSFIVGPVVVGFFILVGITGQLAAFRLVPAQLRLENKDATVYMASIVGVIYAVLLAFIAVAAWESFNKAGEVARKEAAELGDLYRDSRMLDPDVSEAMDRLMEQYVRTVIEEEWPAMASGGMIGNKGWILLEQVAGVMMADTPSDPKSVALMQEMLTRLNDLYDARRDRLLAAEEELEPSVWVVVLFGGLISMLFCWIFGTPHRGFHLFVSSLVAATFGLVMFLIVSFDLPFRGAVQIRPDEFIMVLGDIERMKATLR
ncbi:hypothetical protein [Ferrovibrio sp.]|jgi:hypothetical protein|uniref:bestrophin-like domain n=1 Tax=Ferrovibrio sp. TaxID=1917215 RepID=UPI0035B17376